MRFKICSTHYGPGSEVLLLEDFPVLKDYGFEVVEETVYIYIDTLEQLVKLINDVEYSIIVTKDEIEIYDGYRE